MQSQRSQSRRRIRKRTKKERSPEAKMRKQRKFERWKRKHERQYTWMMSTSLVTFWIFYLLVGFGRSDKEDQELQRGDGKFLQVVYPSVFQIYIYIYIYAINLEPYRQGLRTSRRPSSVTWLRPSRSSAMPGARMQTALDASTKDYIYIYTCHNAYMCLKNK